MKTLWMTAGVVTLAFASTGCQRADTPVDVLSMVDQVRVTALEPSENGTRRFEATLSGDARFSRLEHGAAMLAGASHGYCGEDVFSLVIDPDVGTLHGDRSPVADGERLAMAFECRVAALPNHRIVETGSLRPIALPEAYPFKAAHARPSHEGERTADVAHRLLGDQLREAYTVDCGQSPLVIERIDVATEQGPRELALPDEEDPRTARGPTVHTVLGYRCLESDDAGDA